jgi:predicted peptidase
MKRISRFSLLVSILFFASHAKSQVSKFSYNQYISGTDTLKYRQLYPDNARGRKYPLVIFLHGSGERGNDNEAQLKWGAVNFADEKIMSRYPAIVIAPQCPIGKQWSNFTGDRNSRSLKLEAQPSVPMRLLREVISQAIKTLPIDSTRIYITGLSMGGFGTFDAISRYPELFAAAVPVCGGGDTEKVPVFSSIPIWMFQGAEDPTVNPQFTTDMLSALMKAGAHPGCSILPEVGHFSWLQAYTNEQMMEWLFRQHKNK